MSAQYVSYEETLNFLNSDEYEGVPQTTIETLISAGKEMIDTFFKGKGFDKPPSLVKVVNMELVRAMLADASKNAESIDGYSYTNNPSAFANILARLNYLTIDEKPVSETGRYIEARLI